MFKIESQMEKWSYEKGLRRRPARLYFLLLSLLLPPILCDENWWDKHYLTVETIDEGYRYQTYKVVRIRDRLPCMLKVFKEGAHGLSESIRREVDAMKVLRGAPHVTQLLEVVDERKMGTALVYETTKGEDLDDLVPKLKDVEIRYYALQLLEALSAAHQRNIAHLDVTPSNILIDHDKRELKLIDWGHARSFQPGGRLVDSSVSVTYFAPPEQLLGMGANWAADIWAAGQILGGMIYHRKAEPLIQYRKSRVAPFPSSLGGSIQIVGGGSGDFVTTSFGSDGRPVMTRITPGEDSGSRRKGSRTDDSETETETETESETESEDERKSSRSKGKRGARRMLRGEAWPGAGTEGRRRARRLLGSRSSSSDKDKDKDKDKSRSSSSTASSRSSDKDIPRYRRFYEQLRYIGKVLGTEDLYRFLRDSYINLSILNPDLKELIGSHKGKGLEYYEDDDNKDTASPEAADLIRLMLKIDPRERITAANALKHRYFDPVRNLAKKASAASEAQRNPAPHGGEFKLH